MRFKFMAVVLLIASASWAQDNPLWLRDAKISPDGNQIVFTYKGDIYTVSKNGGKANAITSYSSYDTQPIWSQNGEKIAFSSNRAGGFDVYEVNSKGGEAKRLTSHSNAESAEFYVNDSTLVFSSFIQPAQENQAFPSTMFKQMYQVHSSADRSTLFSPITMEDAHFFQNQILYTDKKGYEDAWRKHHTSSVTRDVWLYDLSTQNFKKLTDFEGEDRNGVFSNDGKSFYYLSEKNGSFNVFKKPLKGGKEEQITFFDEHPVRFLSIDKNDNLAFTYNGEIYYKGYNQKVQKLDIQILADNFEQKVEYETLKDGATSFSISPNGKEIVFVARGDIYVTSADYGTTKRITNTAGQERNVHFSPDGRMLVYAAERNGVWNLFTQELSRKTDEQFLFAAEIAENQITNTSLPSFQPQFSPDGKEIAYLENRTEIRVYNIKKKSTRTILDGKFNYSYSDGDQWFQWSPDSKWILSQYIGIGGWNNTDLAIIKADGTGDVHNITQSGYTENGGKWVLDGNAILFFSDRAGYRSHGSWGAEGDYYLLFLNQKAYDEFNLSKEEREIVNAKKEEKKEDKKEKKKDKIDPIDIDFENLDYRIVKLTTNSTNLSDAALSNDGTKLYYLAQFEKGYDLYSYDVVEKSTNLVAEDVGYGEINVGGEDHQIFVLAKGKIKKIKDDKLEDVAFEADFEHKKAAERAYIFNHAWKQVKDKFYDVNLHNVDWEMYKENYAKFLPHINNNFDFAEMLSEMLGELNASHTGARYYAENEAQRTASLGVFWDRNYQGDGLIINEIIAGSPLQSAGNKIEPGMILQKINGVEIKANEPYWHLLSDKADKTTLLTFYNPKKRKTFEEKIKPISEAEENELLYKRWVQQREDLTEKYSNGEIGYVHIKGMNSSSFREVYKNLLGKYRNKKAVVVDTRFNGGGWLHDDLVTLLGGKEYQQFTPRGQYIGSDPFNKWTKPSVVLMSEGNYSNAHGFPWVYKTLGIGKLVGTPVPGTMTAVWWERQIDPSLVFGIPQVTVVDMQGEPMENNQLEPDVEVYNTPESLLSGEDLQLKKAVEVLLDDLKQ